MFNKILSFSFIVSLSLSSALYAADAGVLLMCDDGTILVGAKPQGNNVKAWLDFGGPLGTNENDKRIAAIRIGNEKTATKFPIQNNHLVGARYVDDNSSRMFFIRFRGAKPSPEELIHSGGGRDYKYVDAQLLLTAALGNGLLPGTNEPLHPRFISRIRKDANQLGGGALRAFIRTPKRAAPIRPFVVPPVPVNAVTPARAAPAAPTRAAPAPKPTRRAAMASKRRDRRVSRRKSTSLSRRVRRQRDASRLRLARQQRRMSRKTHIRKQRRVSRRSRHISRRRRSR
jgi:hypothetical protein